MYFTEEGRQNTKAAVDIALHAASTRNIPHLLVASNTGETARPLAGGAKNIVCVTHAQGFAKPGENEMDAGTRQSLEAAGIRVLTGTHVLSGVERGISRRLGGVYPAELMAHTLRMFGQGVKVCVEIAVMALDAGLIPYGEKVIAIGGTGRGADTAVILTPAHANDMLATRIHEILCKPQ